MGKNRNYREEFHKAVNECIEYERKLNQQKASIDYLTTERNRLDGRLEFELKEKEKLINIIKSLSTLIK